MDNLTLWYADGSKRNRMANKWWTKYLPVKNPAEDPSGWQYPYQGDDWPENEDWYWVWAGDGNQYHPEPYRSTPPQIACWDNKKYRFLAFPEEAVYAWRNAVVAVDPTLQKSEEI